VNPDRLAQLDEERRFLLGSLADLEREHDAGDVDESDYTTLRDGYTVRAAEVLRSIDAGRLMPRDGDGDGSGGRSRVHRRRRLAIAIGTCVVIATLASVAVVRFVAPRSASGGLTGSGPDAIAALLVDARQLQATDKPAALARYRAVLARDPENAEARTYIGWLVANDVLQRGVTALDAPAVLVEAIRSSETQLDKAISLDARYADPKCFKAIIRFRFFADAAGASPVVDACLAAKPPEVVRGLVENLKSDVDKALAGG
jgi:hypothetical protein